MTPLARRKLAARHTALWVAFNVREFDRRRLGGTGAWLFGRRPVRPVRPARRIVYVAWLVFYFFLVTSATNRWLTGTVHDFLGTAVVILAASVVAVLLVILAVLIRRRG